jgi:flagellar hook-basal body complex protein FliE
MNITGLDAAAGLQLSGSSGSKNENLTASFKDMLSDAIKTAEDMQTVSQDGTDALLSGQTDDIAQVMVDMEKAELSLNLVVEVRNKVVDAYNQIMNMQV